MKRILVGDMFTIPLDARRAALGQVVALYLKCQYVAIFDDAVERGSELDLGSIAAASTIALLGLTFDARFANGDWAVVGNKPVRETMPFPAYKVTMNEPGRFVVVDHTGTRQRPADALETERLPFRKFVAPVRLEKAIRARHGIEPWHEAFAELKPSYETTTARLFEAS